jgi:hypothetical protein
MPTSSTAPAGEPAAGSEINIEDAAQRIRALTERILDAAKQTGGESLDAYEKALESLVDFEQKAAGATQLDWVTAVASAHAQFINQVSGAFVKAARSRLQ